jgi:hypothetical protein
VIFSIQNSAFDDSTLDYLLFADFPAFVDSTFTDSIFADFQHLLIQHWLIGHWLIQYLLIRHSLIRHLLTVSCRGAVGMKHGWRQPSGGGDHGYSG